MGVFLRAKYSCKPLKVFPLGSGSERRGAGVGNEGEGAHLISANKAHARQSRNLFQTKVLETCQGVPGRKVGRCVG